MDSRRLKIYLTGVAMGCVILLLIPGKPDGSREPNPWHAQTAPDGYYPRSFVDDTGRSVALERQPRFVVSLAPSVTDMLVEMGMGDHLVGVTRWCDSPAVANVKRVGNLDSPDIELILALRADLVVGTEMTPASVYGQLDQVHVPAVAFKHQALDDVLDDMRRLSLLLGVPHLGIRAAQRIEARRQALRDVLPADIERPTVAILYDLDTLGSAGRGTWVDDLLQVLRLDNIANEAQTPWPSLSREALLARDPDFILMQEPEDPAAVAAFRKRIEGLGQDPMWGRLSAIRQGRLVILGPNMLNVPGPRSIQTLEAMAQAVYGWQGAETGSGE